MQGKKHINRGKQKAGEFFSLSHNPALHQKKKEKVIQYIQFFK
jgi:hypothetical protein